MSQSDEQSPKGSIIINKKMAHLGTLNLITGLIMLIVSIIAILFYLDEIANIENIAYVIPILIIIYGLAIIFIFYGLKQRKQESPLKIWGKFRNLFAVPILIILVVGTPYLLIFDVYAPRKLYVRDETITLEKEKIFNTTYGDLNASTFNSMPWNLPEPNNTEAYAWGEAYTLKHYIHYFNATGRTNLDLLKEIIERIEVVLAHDDWNNDSVPGFGTAKYAGYYVEYPVWDGMIFLPIVETVRLIEKYPTLKTLYAENSSRFLAKAELMIQKWEIDNWVEKDSSIGRYGYYISEPKEAWTYDEPCYNRLAALGRVCVELYQITSNATYLDRVIKMGRCLKIIMEENSYTIDGDVHQCYIWPYSEPDPRLSPFPEKFGAEDVSHGSIEIDFIDDCYQLGHVYTKSDMEKFANTFFDIIFKGLTKTPIFSDHVDGKISGKNYFRNIREGYAKMYRYYRSPELALQILHRSFERLVDEKLASVGVVGCLIYLLEVEKNSIWV
jgi:hypothetical protein